MYFWNPATKVRYCAAFDRCPIAGLPKITPANQRALRMYNLCHSGLLSPRPEDVSARMLDLMGVIDVAVSAELLEETLRLTDA